MGETSLFEIKDCIEYLYNNIKFDRVIEIMKKRDEFVRFKKVFDKHANSTEANRDKVLMTSIILNEYGFKEFIHILLHTGQDRIVRKLDQQWRDMCDLTICDPNDEYKPYFSFGHQNHMEKLFIKDTSNSTSLSTDYPMIASPRGYCYLINNYFTIGTYKQMQRFRNIFYQLHFDVKMKKNLSVATIMRKMKKVSEDPSLLRHNAFIFMIISRANESYEIFDDCNASINVQKIIEMFDNSKCSNMKNKPRLFFFNCCPTENKSMSTATETHDLIIPEDIFICYSTVDIHLNGIDWYYGSVFGEELANEMRKKASYKDLESVIRLVKLRIKATRGLNISTKTPIKCFNFDNNKRLMFNYAVPYIKPFDSVSESGQICTEQTLDSFIERNLKQRPQSSGLVNLLGKLCKNLKFMHDNNEIHGNIKPKNIKILIPAKSGKIHAELIPPKNAGGALCWKSPEAIELLNICDEYKATKEDDIFSMGCIIYYVLTNGKHPFLFKHVNILEAKADYSGLLGDRNKIYLDLIKSMLSKNKTDRPLISHVINHPIFWDSKKTKEFYVDIKPIFTAKTSPNINIVDFVSIRDNIITKLESKKNEIFGTNWLLKLCQKVQDFENSRMEKKADGYQFRIRDPTSYIHLLNYIADKARHWDQWPLEIKPNQSYIEYHSKKFPLLLIYTYNELKPLKSISEIQKYYL